MKIFQCPADHAVPHRIPVFWTWWPGTGPPRQRKCERAL